MSTIKANTLLHSDGSTTNPPSIPALDQRMAKAWVNFDGTGTVAIRSSYGISSIVDNGTGSFTINFSTAFANTNYAHFADVMDVNSNSTLIIMHTVGQLQLAGSAVVYIQTTAGELEDQDRACYMAFAN